MALPKIAIIPTGGTIQNGQPLVTSTKAGGTFNLLRPQRLHESVSVKIAKEDLDGNPLTIGTGENRIGASHWTLPTVCICCLP